MNAGLHFIENGGHGRPVVFIHGNSLSGAIWKEQLNAPELAHLRLVAIDLPGHGRSARYADRRTYSPDSFAEDVTAFIRDMEEPVLVGHSLGGHIAIRVAAAHKAVRGVFLIGTPPLATAADLATGFVPSPLLGKIFSADVTEADAFDLARAFTWPDCPLVSEVARMIVDTQPRVRGDVGSMVATGAVADEIAMIRSSEAEVCLAHAANESFISQVYLAQLPMQLFWERKVQVLPNTGHCAQMQQPGDFNRLLLRFMDALL